MKANYIQKGFSAILAIVLLVLMALLGAYMSTQLSVGSLSTSLSFRGMQAWFAARSGIEWGIYQLLNQATPPSSCVANMEGVGGMTIDGYNVSVDCIPSSQITEGSDKYYVYSLTATATGGISGNMTYVYRQISVNVTDAP